MKLRSVFLASLAILGTTSALAVPAGTWTVGVGAAYVDPDSTESSIANGAMKVAVDADTRPSVTFEYFPINNVGIELLGALPFKHDLTVKTANGDIKGKTTQLPPTLSVNYHFDGMNSTIKPFIGVGVNYTTFFNERLYTGKATQPDFKLDDSVGAAGHVGVDFRVNPTSAVRVDARYIDIQTDVKLNGQDLGTVDVNPWVYGVSYVKSF